MIVERTACCRWPRPTPTNAERLEDWRRKYVRVPVEVQCAPIRKPNTNTPDSSGKGT